MRVSKILISFSALFILLHIWGAVSPSHYNWGFHFFAFYSSASSIPILIFSLLLFYPTFREYLLKIVEKFHKNITTKFPTWINFFIAISLLILLIILFPAKGHLLGDGALLLREVSGIKLGDELPPTFDRQFLVVIILQFITTIFKTNTVVDAETIFILVDFIAGLFFVLIIFLTLRLIKCPSVEKFFLGCILFFAAGSQLFLGYVEIYAFFYVATFAYIIVGWYTLKKNLNLFFPILFFTLMVGLHIGSLIFFPTLLLLLAYRWKTNRIETISITGISLILFVIIITANFKEVEIIFNKILYESRWNFLPLSQSGNYFSYPIFSFVHLIDWLNAIILFSPFVIPLTIVFLVTRQNKYQWKDPVLIFLLFFSILGLIFTYIIFFALGMARDWDFMASFFLPLLILNVYVLSKSFEPSNTRSVTLLIVTLSAIHWFSWIGVNSNEQRHLERVKLLHKPYFLGEVPRLNYYENLGSYFWWKGDYQQACSYFEQYLQIDSTNPRILGNISAIYTHLENNEKNLWALKQAASANSKNPAIYINLGVAYFKAGDTLNAMNCYNKAISLDSTRAKAYANLGSIYVNKKNFDLASFNFSKAISLGLTDPLLYREAGAAYYLKGDYEKSIEYLDHYLTLAPNDEGVRLFNNKLKNKIDYLKRKK